MKRRRQQGRWRTATYQRGLETVVPEGPGVYSIARVTRQHGLITAVEHLYVGKSINLRRRFVQHVHPGESNPGLNGLDQHTEMEFWWRRAPAEEIASLEAKLIHDLQPSLNRRRPTRIA